jgi:hypothetical protein
MEHNPVIPFMFSNSIEKWLHELRKYAHKNIFTLEDMKRLSSKDYDIMGDKEFMKNLFMREITIPMGYRFFLLVETHWNETEQKEIIMRHLSAMYVDLIPGAIVPPEIVQQVMTPLGFVRPLNKCLTYFTDQGTTANILEPIEEGSWEANMI